MRTVLLAIGLLVSLPLATLAAGTATYPLQVLPSERKVMTDPVTGVELTFATTAPGLDRACYFHQQAWLADESLLLFTTDRGSKDMMGYLPATGELVVLRTPSGRLAGAACARRGNVVYAYRGRELVALTLKIAISRDPARIPSRVTARERVVATLPENPIHYVTENADGTLIGSEYRTAAGTNGMCVTKVATGRIRDLGTLNFGGHMQFSRHDPLLFSFAGRPDRLMVWDLRRSAPRCLHKQAPGEHVTHESWWVDGQMLFLGSYLDKEEHLKVIDPSTGVIRIIGAGAWVPWASTEQSDGDDILNRWNWWHASGDWQGRYVAADNWYGDIVVFDGKTTRLHRLTLGHRKYGGGSEAEDPHVAWDRSGRRVVFTSQLLGRADVCIATLPSSWPTSLPLAPDDPVIIQDVEKRALPPGVEPRPQRPQ